MQKQEIPPSTRCHSGSDLALNQLAVLQAINRPPPRGDPVNAYPLIWEGLQDPPRPQPQSTAATPDGWPPLPSQQTGQSFHAAQIKEQREWHHVSAAASRHQLAHKEVSPLCVVRKVSFRSMTTSTGPAASFCRLFSLAFRLFYGAASKEGADVKRVFLLIVLQRIQVMIHHWSDIKDKIFVFVLNCFSAFLFYLWRRRSIKRHASWCLTIKLWLRGEVKVLVFLLIKCYFIWLLFDKNSSLTVSFITSQNVEPWFLKFKISFNIFQNQKTEAR